MRHRVWGPEPVWQIPRTVTAYVRFRFGCNPAAVFSAMPAGRFAFSPHHQALRKAEKRKRENNERFFRRT